MNALDASNVNSLWCSVLVETLGREGLRYAVVSPGSRSTPLTMAVARHPDVEAIVAVDERSAGFHALGLARAGGLPVVLICTSGSAGAHYLPAMIEAHETGTPLIAITADRPPELRECASGQTIDQHRLFGRYATWYHECALPELSEGLFAYLRQTMRQAWGRAEREGPVHLNAPFRDPLAPQSDGGKAAEFAKQIDAEFWTVPPAATTTTGLRLIHQVTTSRGLIVAGPTTESDQAAYAEQIYTLARSTGWPILADGLSPARHYAPPDVTVVSSYDLILRNHQLARDLTPRYVLGLESWPTSKVLREWLNQCLAEILMVSPRPSNSDAVHGRTREITAPLQALEFQGKASADQTYRRAWADAQSQANRELTAWMSSAETSRFEGRVTWELSSALPPAHAVVIASSMPVRDWEYFCPAAHRQIHVYASRGANGIDGTLSTALGVARASNQPTVLLTGDLAFLHDSNGLMLAREFSGDLTIIVVNNAGGGIFEHLPIASLAAEFDRYFATPMPVQLGLLCAAHGVSHQSASVSEIAGFLSTQPRPSGVRVIEVTTDRKADAGLRKRGFRDLARRLS
jgi:2-succinyl-5-enolpyruvyl-6-hydroxy-3-cyclohexene-1-carboxylate synthase